LDGESVVMMASFIGEPQPHIEWYRNDALILSSSDFTVSVSDSETTLSIADAFPEDSGTYRVVATNDLGEATTTADLRVSSRSEIKEMPQVCKLAAVRSVLKNLLHHRTVITLCCSDFASGSTTPFYTPRKPQFFFALPSRTRYR